MAAHAKPRIVGFNHIALEVGDIDEALAFYGRLFRFELRGKSDSMAFIDLGDQFIALQSGRTQPADDGRHFGLAVDDKEAARAAQLEWPCLMVRSLIFGTLGATVWRSSVTTTFSSPRHRTCCVEWA
jgi:catechol 2,3-dioxygenase-like lactoylglutathione lyase family enzyme